MSYFIEFQPQEINLVWAILLEGKVSGKDAPVMTAILQNIQKTVQAQDEAEKFRQQLETNAREEFNAEPKESTEEPKEVEVEKVD